jgi:ABC-type sugar transport system ATPase subunit
MSGGQQQRVACARTLIGRPDLIFADEPTGNLDSNASAEILSFLRQSVTEFEQSIVMVTHDAHGAAYADRVVSAWFDLARAGTYEELDRYLERRMAAGLLRTMTDSEVAARLVTESLSWFAWHRREGRDANLYHEAAGKRTVVEFICAALIPQTVGETTAGSLGPTKSAGKAKKRDPRRKGPNARS